MYTLIEDRGCGIRYEVATSEDMDNLVEKAIHECEDDENINGDNEPFRYEIWDDTDEVVWSSVSDL